jgi:hypothetical protein
VTVGYSGSQLVIRYLSDATSTELNEEQTV